MYTYHMCMYIHVYMYMYNLYFLLLSLISNMYT